MKLSETTLENVKQLLRVDYNHDDNLITVIMESAKGYICTFTGLTEDELDEYAQVVHAFNCLCIDMYDNRGAEMSTSLKENPAVEKILLSVAVNYL